MAGEAGKVIKARASMALNVMLRSLGVTCKDVTDQPYYSLNFE